MRNIGNEIRFLLRERELAARIGEDRPAAKDDRGQSGCNEKQQSAADIARIFLQLLWTHEIKRRFPMRKRFPDFRRDKWPPPIAIRLVWGLGGDRPRPVVQKAQHVFGRSIVR